MLRTKLEVDLELVEREAAQVEQAGIAGAEIVEGKPHAERLEAEHGELGRIHVAEQRALGDLELEPGGIKIGLGQNAFDHVDEIGAAELQRRDVDRDREARPGLAVEAGAAQHLLAELDDQPAVLGNRNEFGGRNLAAFGMRPTAERLDAHHHFPAVVDDRLIGDPQAVVLDRGAQLVFQELALDQVRIHRRVVDAGSIAALVLRPVERQIGMAHDVGRAADILVDDGDADAGADDDGLIGDGVGRADGGDHARGDRLQGRVIEAAGGDDGELVAAEPGDHVVATQGAGEPLGDAADELVADRVAERVVDILEVVEIDVEHGRGRTALAHLLDHGLEPLAEEDAIGQPAKGIVQGEMPQPRFAGGDGRGRAPHMAEDQRGQQRKAGERNGDEGHDAVDDLGSGLLRRPRELRDRAPLRIGQIEGVVAFGDDFFLELAEVVQLETRRDVREHVVVDELDAHDDRSPSVGFGGGAVGRGHRHAGNDGGAAQKCLQAHGAVAAGILRDGATGEDAAGVRLSVAPHQIEHVLDIRLDRVEPIRVDAAMAERGVEKAVGGVGDEDEIMVEERLEPRADVNLHPFGIEMDPDAGKGRLGSGDALDLAQHALSVIGERSREQLALGVERHLVGALRGAEHRNHDADDRDRHDHPDRDHHAQA